MSHGIVATLYSQHHRWLQSWLRRKTGSAFDAADLAQDTFTRLLTHPAFHAAAAGGPDAVREPRAYILTVAYRLVINHQRRQSLEQAYLAALAMLPEPLAPSPEHQLVIHQTLQEIDAMLDAIAPKARTQEVKRIVARLKAAGRSEADLHRKVHRPWGWYDSVDNGERFQVKRIVVRPGATLSLQMHHHRAEHWVVVRGTAKVTRGDETLLLAENESTYIPLGVRHRLENPGQIPLEIIEVQSGSYLGEDDIVRFEHTYGR